MMETGKSTFRLAAGFILVFAAAGCSRKNPPSPARLVGETERFFRIQDGDKERGPRFFIQAHPFEGEAVFPEPFTLDGAFDLTFVPIAEGTPVEDARFEVYLACRGEKPVLLHGCRPCFLGDESMKGVERAALLSRLVTVDLERFQGKRAAFRWILRAGNAPLRGAAACLALRRKRPAGTPRPDMLIVCSDTHRFDYALGGEGRRLMPNLQRFRAEAVTYLRAYSCASWTLPSLASLFTGLPPRFHRTGFRTDAVAKERFRPEAVPPGRFAFKCGNEYRILTCYPDNLATFTERLRTAGYVTAAVFSNPLYRLSGLFADGQDLVVDTGVVPGDRVNRQARAILDARPAGQPLFLFVHYMDVHQWQPWYLEKRLPKAAAREHPEAVCAAYGEAVRDTDRNLGDLLAAWRRNTTFEESLVVFFADHGEHLLDPGSDRVGHGNSMEDVLLHVPLLVHYPRGLGPRPGVVETPVSLTDLFATVLDLVGLKAEPSPYGGRSLLGAGEGEEPRTFYADFQLYGKELSSVRQGSLKLVLNLERGTRRLVDTAGLPDPGGEEACAVSDTAAEARLLRLFEAYRARGEAATRRLRSTRKVDAKEALDNLEALGYVR